MAFDSSLNGNTARRLLLKGGTVLIHDANDNVQALERDILIENNRISKISKNISDITDAESIDCTDKIISPGFIDTHHHLWQTQLKGRHANELLLDYMASGNLQSSNYTKSDIYWGQLGGSLEAINAGTTTVVDHSHVNVFAGAASAAISATASSGLRCVYGYCPTARVATWSPFAMNPDMLAPWVMDEIQELGKKAPFGDGRVTMGLAFDLWFLPEQVVKDLFDRAREVGVELATTHAVSNPQMGSYDLVQQIKSLGLLDSRMLFSHLNGYAAESVKDLADAGAHISSTPSTEMQMALGDPVCLNDDLPQAQAQSSLGIDCHSNQASSIVYEMRLGLQGSRAKHNQKLIDQDLAPRKISKTVQDVFNLGTIQGARAIGRGTQLGSIAEGKLADLVIFDANTPELICAAEQDPIAAVVLHSSIGNVDTVIVDGIVRKCQGKLVGVTVEESMVDVTDKRSLEWADVAKAMRKSRAEILQREAEKQNLDDVKKGVISSFNIDLSKLRG
ncbi:related to cytosine deaminase and related metal-dependent hydrolases [Fusarium mangiferae]|uniref:Related to cytosine deaminase and related metal-dependent hydrolases n=1 Tax=Fusarium mangiferae TaxID=192010 RepID=A0A1L7TQM7_FUSMA|nr:related to cytosine deaminase and related metal-dependent hydrolases [Fusarium mangiferae]CVK97581.1 related to cytosine deaminase and related metal-dependent hydrolases [Fusarium mangiferae]